MRIFYLTTEFLWPPHHGGRVRSLAQLRLLSSLPEVTQITFLGLSEVPVSAADLEAMATELPRVRVLPPLPHPIHLRQHPHRLGRVAWLRLSSGVPYLAGKWDSPAIRRELVQALGSQAYDVVYIDHLGMARYLPELRRACPAARLVIEEHNVESDFFRQFAEQRRPPWRWVAEAEWRAARRFEAQALGAVHAVVAISATDAADLAALAGVTPRVVPQVVPFTRRRSTHGHGAGTAAPRLCYVGNLTWHPNVRGLDWLCGEVWPRVVAALPAATLTIAGSGLPLGEGGRPRVPERWRVPGVETVGFVADLQPLYERSLGFVAPILGGSGIRIKLLEALRAGMPVVTTPMGAYGLPIASGREALIESSAEGFAQAVVSLCNDPALRDRLREAGYDYLEAHHGLPIAQKAMREVLGA